MSKHTPGPWVVSPDSVTTVMEVGPLKRFIAHATDLSVKCSSKEYDERDSNARLIAAAPEMLEALKWTLARVERLAPHKAIEGDAALYEIAAARAAIAKATGEQS
jgi:hypothetical protein